MLISCSRYCTIHAGSIMQHFSQADWNILSKLNIKRILGLVGLNILFVSWAIMTFATCNLQIEKRYLKMTCVCMYALFGVVSEPITDSR